MKKLNLQSALPMLFVAALIMISGGGRLAPAQERFEEELADSSNSQPAGADDLSTNPVLDFGDAPEPPYPTTLAANGAQHVIMPGFCLGNIIALTVSQMDNRLHQPMATTPIHRAMMRMASCF